MVMKVGVREPHGEEWCTQVKGTGVGQLGGWMFREVTGKRQVCSPGFRTERPRHVKQNFGSLSAIAKLYCKSANHQLAYAEPH